MPKTEGPFRFGDRIPFRFGDRIQRVRIGGVGDSISSIGHVTTVVHSKYGLGYKGKNGEVYPIFSEHWKMISPTTHREDITKKSWVIISEDLNITPKFFDSYDEALKQAQEYAADSSVPCVVSEAIPRAIVARVTLFKS